MNLSELEPDGVIGERERSCFNSHFRAIAELMQAKDIWRNPWSVEVDGCVYQFTVKGYAKKGSKRWQEQQDALARSREISQLSSDR